MMDWKYVQAQYPVNKEMIWLNNCGMTPAGEHIVSAVNRFMTGYSQKGILTETADYMDVKQRIKSILGQLLGAESEELALIHNTSEGMNILSHGLHLKAGEEIILLENEYPSNVYPWRHWEENGVILKTAAMGSSPENFLEGLIPLITDQTRLISLSAVHWCTGMPLPLEQIGKICREKNILFSVDGAQGVGMQPMDVRKMNIDFMAFSAWKWLMGPPGMGVLYISKKRLKDLKSVFVGTGSVINDREYLPYKTQLKPDADRFTISTADFLNWVYFLASLEFLCDIGFDRVRTRIFELTEYLNQRLRMMGFEVLSDQFPDHPTGITVCQKAGLASDRLAEKLKEQKVIAALRLGRIRFSPHIYLSKQQMDETARAISEACLNHLYSRTVNGSDLKI
ncbi:MAG: aminotransferase class V-fold PLP-dependent enzyme [Desulfobacterales bacterium]